MQSDRFTLHHPYLPFYPALDHSIKALTLSSSYLYSLIIHIFSCKDITIAKVILTLMNKF